jgi:hypothetical protein
LHSANIAPVCSVGSLTHQKNCRSPIFILSCANILSLNYNERF